jgi:hypothetical protein
MTLGWTLTLMEMSTRNLPGGKGQPMHKTYNSPPSVSQLSRKYGILDIAQCYWPPWGSQQYLPKVLHNVRTQKTEILTLTVMNAQKYFLLLVTVILFHVRYNN